MRCAAWGFDDDMIRQGVFGVSRGWDSVAHAEHRKVTSNAYIFNIHIFSSKNIPTLCLVELLTYLAHLYRFTPFLFIMVLEALAAVGLAANILQFVEFSYNLTTSAREIYNSSSGLTAENQALELIANDLLHLSGKFTVQGTSTSTQSVGDKKLSDLALASTKVAEELLEAIERLKNKDNQSQGNRRSFRQALQTVLQKDGINNLVTRLERLRDQLSLHMASKLRCGFYN